MSNDRRLRLALFGSGRIGQVHARNIAAHPDIDLVLIADSFIDGARRLAESTGARAVQDHEDVFADTSLDGVIIGSPTSTHVDLISCSVARGLAVLCEKPIDLNIDTVLACREQIKDSTVPIMLGFNRRFDPSFAAIRTRVQAGKIGKLEQLTITSCDPEPAPRDYIAGRITPAMKLAAAYAIAGLAADDLAADYIVPSPLNPRVAPAVTAAVAAAADAQ